MSFIEESKFLLWLVPTIIVYILLSIIQWNFDLKEWATWGRGVLIVLSVGWGIMVAFMEE